MIGWLQHRPHLFGPIVFYDLIRSGRRKRFLVVRFLYGLFLLLMLVLAYSKWYIDEGKLLLPPSQLAEFTSTFFVVFMLSQYICILALTPAYTAGAIAEEKERQTLDALLASELSTREVVFGFYLARMAKLGMVLLTGLPILGFLQFMGGIDPVLMLAGFAACALTLVSLAALSLLHSMLANKPREAIVRTYFILLAYLALSSCSQLLLVPVLGIASFPSTETWSSPVTVEDVVQVFSSGNFLVLVGRLIHDLFTGGSLAGLVSGLLARYAWFHGAVAVFCCAWVMLRLRANSQPAEGISAGYARRHNRAAGSRLLGAQPVLWKELVVDAALQRRWGGRLMTGMGVAFLLWPGIHCCTCFGRTLPQGANDVLGSLLNLWIRCSFSLLGTLMLLQVAFKASGGICGERDRQTLDGLLAAPLTNRAILAAKWLGSVTAPRYTALVIVIIAGFGIWTGTVHPLAVFAWLVSWFVFAAFLAGLGLWNSVASKTARHATFGTMILCLFLLGACSLAALNMNGAPFIQGESFNLIPPVLLLALAFQPQELSLWWYGEVPYKMWLLGAIWMGWLLISLVLWKLVQIRFDVVTGRRETGNPLEESASTKESSTWIQWKPDWPMLRRTILASLPVFAPTILLVGIYYAIDRNCDRALAEAMAATQETEGPWHIEDLEAQRARISDDENSAMVAVTVANQIPSDWLSATRYGKLLEALEPEKQLRTEDLQFLQAELKTVEHVVPQAMKLKDMPRGHMPIVYASDPFSTDREIVQRTRRLGTMLQSRILVQIQLGKYDEALESCRVLVHAGRAIYDEPIIVTQLVRIAIESMALPLVERCLAQGQPSEEALARLQKVFERNENFQFMLQAMRGERALLDQQMQVLQQGNSSYLGYYDPRPQKKHIGLPSFPHEELLVLCLSQPLKRQRAMALQAMSEELAAFQLPPGQREATLTTVVNSWIKKAWLIRYWTPAWTRLTDSFLRCQAEQECLLVALAAERFRKANGTWPRSIQELTPTYVSKVPRDPFDGLPIRLIRWQYGIVVYSIGMDRFDNGGTINRKQWWGGGTDVGIRLFDPVYRRQPPPAAKANKEGDDS